MMLHDVVGQIVAARAGVPLHARLPDRQLAPEVDERRVRLYHTTRPLAPPYSLHTVLLKVES